MQVLAIRIIYYNNASYTLISYFLYNNYTIATLIVNFTSCQIIASNLITVWSYAEWLAMWMMQQIKFAYIANCNHKGKNLQPNVLS